MSNKTQGQGIKNMNLAKGHAELSRSQICFLPPSVHLLHSFLQAAADSVKMVKPEPLNVLFPSLIKPGLMQL